MKWITSLHNDKCELEVFECECGFHLGIDATWVDQDVYDLKYVIECPNCKTQKMIMRISGTKFEGT